MWTGCDCAEILALNEQGKIDTTPLITHRYQLEDIEEAYRIFEKETPADRQGFFWSCAEVYCL